MKTKTAFIVLLFTMVCQVATLAQKPEKFDFDKFKTEKIAFITQALDLTPAEAEKFWPVYNEFEKKKFEMIDKRHELEKTMENVSQNLSDAQYVELSRKMASFSSEDGKIMTEYNDKFLKILPPKKVVQLYISEGKFRHQLLRNYRNKDDKDDK